MPYEDFLRARGSLPEFAGTKAEDSVRFLKNSESILIQAQIHQSGWCRVIELQLLAGTWWKSIKVLDLSWDEFRIELLEQYNNAEIQPKLRAEIVSSQQQPN